ncbi:transglutaminase domain-containing protein [Sphaerobacter sp.]|uniref:DUF4129 domain-containing transglutaminase family protein n=1 Tax=Sphaerobacter sp. TaxID=2099654 RepID=UPI001DC414F0|nr:transglutaminase domain-containing protein [Sphaerobacter sp.]MBX5443718.1 transglutaminase domain-containing protein [Sphaerobacter sp.]
MHRFAIREGWTTFFLIVLVVFTATWSVQLADWADGLHILSTITLVGLLVGLVLSNIRRLPSLAAHIVALLLGSVVVLYQMTGFLSDTLGGRREKLAYLWERWELWSSAVWHGERADDLYLFVLLMASLLWVLSYISVWFVFRSRWVWLTLLLPGVILLLNMGYSQRISHSLVVLYLFAAILLLMRFTVSQRELTWRSLSVPYPETLAWRGLWVGSYLALLVIAGGWLVPLSMQSEQIQAGWQRINGPWRQVENTFNSWFSSLRGPGGVGIGGFASFGDRFELGGPLRLSDEPVVLVKGDGAPYLVAHRYSTFDGRAWESDLDSRAASYAPLLEFDAGQPFPRSANSGDARSEAKYSIEVYQPRGAVVYSTEVAAQASVPTRLQVGWHNYRREVLDVQSATEETTPHVLWPLVELLKEADYTPPEPTPTPVPEGETVEGEEALTATPDASAAPSTPARFGIPEQQRAIMDQVEQLGRIGIRVRFEPDPGDYRVHALSFSGPLPVYDDVDALYARDGLRAGETYEIVSLVSEATADDLRAAGTDYPAEITERYLQLPDYSERTRQLAEQLAEGKDNPYDIATAIEEYLRQNLTYNENVPAPPAGRDLVDYFLFEQRQGYCTYYASAMVEMLRILDIPSRVAVGFYPAEFDSNSGGYLYRDRNAHAWVEVYFPKYGWIPFEPTAARRAIQRGTPEATPASTANGSAISGDNIPLDREAQILMELNEGFGAAGGSVAPLPDKTTRAEWIARGLVLAVVLGITLFSFLWMRGTRGMSPTTRFFSKVQRATGWSGLPTRTSMTPYEYAAVVSRHLPGARPHIRLLTDLYVRERYGQRPPTENELNRARAAWQRLRGLLLRYGLVRRWRRRHGGDDDGQD